MVKGSSGDGADAGVGAGAGAGDYPVTRSLRGRDRVAVVHHWDADGISSAAMVIEEVRRASPGAGVLNTSPSIGRWSLDADEIASIRGWGPDLLVLVDLAVREDDLATILDGVGAPVLMVDHHRAEVPLDPRVEYHNPVAEGGSEEDNPSCTWVLRRVLGTPEDLLVMLGVFGDRGRGVVTEPVWPHLEAFLASSDLSEKDMHLLVDLVDSSAKRVDLEGVNTAVGRLLEGWHDPRGLLELAEWQEGNLEVELALSEQLRVGPETELDGVLYKTIDTRYLIISTVARRLIRTRGNRVVVVTNLGYSDVEDQVYVRRSGDLDLAPLIPRMRERGLSAGGKSEVLGVIVPKGELEGVMSELMEFLGRSPVTGAGTGDHVR